MIPKEIKYNLHYDDVRGDFLRPPHGTTPATVKPHLHGGINVIKK